MIFFPLGWGEILEGQVAKCQMYSIYEHSGPQHGPLPWMECEWNPGLIQTTLPRTQAPGQVLGKGGGTPGAAAASPGPLCLAVRSQTCQVTSLGSRVLVREAEKRVSLI